MYYIYGDEEFLIKEEIKKIIDKNPNHKVYSFNLEIKINEAINQITSFSLLENEKIIIFNNFPFLFSKIDNEINAIVRALEFKPTSNIVIITNLNPVNKRNSNNLFSFLEKNATCIECKSLSQKEIVDYTKNRIALLGGTIGDIDLFYFLSKVPNKLMIINSEIEKLVMLDKNITQSNIDDVVQKYDLSNIFDFINAFHNNNAEMLFKNYYEKINQGETIQNLISQISNVLELCSRLYSLKRSNTPINEIEKILDKHSFVIKKNLEFLDSIGYKKISEYLNLLSKIDYKIKSGQLDEKIGFERFLLQTIKD